MVEVHKKMRADQKRVKKKKRMREAAEELKLKSDPSPAKPDPTSNGIGGAAPAEPVAESMEHYFELYESAVDSHRSTVLLADGGGGVLLLLASVLT